MVLELGKSINMCTTKLKKNHIIKENDTSFRVIIKRLYAQFPL